MKRCVFAGPSLYREPVPDGVTRFGPVALGSVFRAVEAGYRRIGIVDGVFGNLPSVWHKEILFAISEGVEVTGAGSMGALRAAELKGLGMLGLGSIFRLFRSGAWTDDDEVAVLHCPRELDFRPLSDAMANIRFTLRALRRQGWIDRQIEAELIARIKPLHFSDRTPEQLQRQFAKVLGKSAGARQFDAYRHTYVDIKRLDARILLRHLGDRRSGTPPARSRFQPTDCWTRQFERQIADVPQLS